jgi:2-C-methyl-D-erythritol 2,4-cyclodiphosphate synthase/2-C-methyl-D-erythritol 4-phosphate cytidylyltransferase
MNFSVIIVAAGTGKRMDINESKLLLRYEDTTVIEKTISAFNECENIRNIVLVTNDEKIITKAKSFSKISNIVHGGEQRQDSVRNALNLSDLEEYVLIHDGARPFITKELIKKVCENTITLGNATPGIKLKDTIKVIDCNQVISTPNRDNLVAIQTPQGFKTELLKRAYEFAYTNQIYGTDDAYLIELIGEKSYIVDGDYENIKITTIDDLKYLKRSDKMFRTGLGYDVHKLVQGRELILGGVKIPHSLGLLGHSDADVLIHSIMDALLGASALGDIGKHFPDTDNKYKDANSLILLKEVCQIIKDKGYSIINIDATIVAQKPKLLPFMDEMKTKLSKVMEIDVNNINIKATTTETLGFEGREEGISSMCNCLLLKS